MALTRRLFCALLPAVPFVLTSCGGDEQSEPSGSTFPPVDESPPTSPPYDPDYPEPAPPPVEPTAPALPEPDDRAEGTSGTDVVADEPDFVSVLDDLYDRAGEGNVTLSDAWDDLFGHPAVVTFRVGERVFEDCLYFTVDDEPVLGANAGVLMEVDRAHRAVTWWCGAERLDI